MQRSSSSVAESPGSSTSSSTSSLPLEVGGQERRGVPTPGPDEPLPAILPDDTDLAGVERRRPARARRAVRRALEQRGQGDVERVAHPLERRQGRDWPSPDSIWLTKALESPAPSATCWSVSPFSRRMARSFSASVASVERTLIGAHEMPSVQPELTGFDSTEMPARPSTPSRRPTIRSSSSTGWADMSSTDLTPRATSDATVGAGTRSPASGPGTSPEVPEESHPARPTPSTSPESPSRRWARSPTTASCR